MSRLSRRSALRGSVGLLTRRALLGAAPASFFDLVVVAMIGEQRLVGFFLPIAIWQGSHLR